MLRGLSLLIALFTAHVALADTPPGGQANAGQRDKGLFWQVHGKTGGTAYLVGSIHMLDKSIYPLRPEIEAAFTSSTSLAVEANIASDEATSAKVQQSLMAAATYPPGQTLQQHVSKKTYEAVQKRLDLTMFNGMKPWFVAMMLEVIAAQKAGLNADLGLDAHFLHEAGRKKIIELEGMEFQIQLFDHLPADQQEGMLYSAAIGTDDFETGIHDMLDAWRKGDAEKMNDLVHKDEREDPSLAPVMEAILTRRNVGMADKIAALLESGKTTFVVVGAGHFVGPLGVVQLLRKKGYTVEQK